MPAGELGNHSANRIFGEALNPYHFVRTVGGVCGSEAGLTGSKCCPFAIGTSYNGSISIPAAFNGIYAFRPTSGRFHMHGIGTAHLKKPKDLSKFFEKEFCSMGQSVDDCVIGFRVLTDKDAKREALWWNDLDFLIS